MTATHEILHFIWFENWKLIFPYEDETSYNVPDLPWLFSESAIDALFKEPLLKKYCYKEKPAYEYFYDVTLQEKNMIQVFAKLYRKSLSIEDFMIQGYHLIQANKEFFEKLV